MPLPPPPQVASLRRTAGLVLAALAWLTTAGLLSLGQQASFGQTADPSVPLSRLDGHWGEAAVGFRWTEDDSRDARWNQTSVGPFLASSLPTPGGMIAKAFTVKLETDPPVSATYDLQSMQLLCAWQGGFLKFDPARYGIIAAPSIDGQLILSSSASTASTGPRKAMSRPDFQGHYLHGDRVVLGYRINNTPILESPWAARVSGSQVVARTIRIDASTREVVWQWNVARSRTVVIPSPSASEDERRLIQALLSPAEPGSRQPVSEGGLTLTIPARTVPWQFTVVHIGTEPSAETTGGAEPPENADGAGEPIPSESARDAIVAACQRHERLPPDVTTWTQAGPGRWGEPLITSGRVAANLGPYVVDTLTLPLENRFRALMFVSGHDFFSQPDRMAISTVHGDVWLVDGVNADLKQLVWKRFATGLYQPLGLRIVRDQIYVLGRDQITRLHDTNGDGEADYYESFNHSADTSAGGHDFSTCLETDSDGNFWYVSQRGVHRISADGKSYTTIAEGLRNPNGLGILPRRDVVTEDQQSTSAGRRPQSGPFAWVEHDVVTTAPQEGEWTPASAVYEVTQDGYYGYGGPRITADRPLGYDPPLSWQPRNFDNSTAGQVWVTGDRWGPLRGTLLTFSFGQCRTLLQMVEPRRRELSANWPLAGAVTDGTRMLSFYAPTIPAAAQLIQAATLQLPLAFESGIMRGRFSPHDGQLYVSGMRGWVSAAVQDGCLQRVRYTGQATAWPTAVHSFRNGLALTFATPLEPASATDPENYSVEAWNYHYRADYGSAEFRPSAGQTEGHDSWNVKSAVLLDSNTVFLEIEPWQTVMQLALRYQIETGDHQPMRHIVYHTLNALPDLAIDLRRFERPGEAARQARANRQQQLGDRLRAGLLWRFTPLSGSQSSANSIGDARVDRLAALHVRPHESPSRFTPAGNYAARAEGYVHVPWRAHYAFQLDGTGSVALRVNDREVIAGRTDDLSQLARRTVLLDRGFNRIELDYEPPASGESRLRLLWQAEDGPLEPVSPAALFHDPNDNQLQQSSSRRRGYQLATELRCANCHPGLGKPLDRAKTLGERQTVAPSAAAPSAAAHEDTAQNNAAAPESWLPRDRNPAPNLAGIGSRIRTPWLIAWIFNPDDLTNDHHMPQVIHSLPADQRQQAVADLVAYLVTLSNPRSTQSNPTNPETTNPETPKSDTTDSAASQDLSLRGLTELKGRSGDELFIQLGCAVCHDFEPVSGPGDDSGDGAVGSKLVYRTLWWARAKYERGSLIAYLRAPQRHWPAARMPDFRLSITEAAALADYVLEHSSATWPPSAEVERVHAEDGDAKRGEAWFARLGCAACHAVTSGSVDWPTANGPKITALATSETLAARGCVASRLESHPPPSRISQGSPWYRLSDAQRADLAAYLATPLTDWGTEPPSETARWLVERSQCIRCHDRDGIASHRRERLAEMMAGHVPEALPSLTWTGDKLHTLWIERTVAGQLSHPTRPWLAARMPSFPAIAADLAGGLSSEHGWPASTGNSPPPADAERIELGRQLTLPTGLDCRQCHAIGLIQPRGDEKTQLAHGIAFELVRERLRPAEFLRYALDPPRYDPSSRMPKLSPDGQHTALRSLADGNAVVQFQAIWHYLNHFEKTDEYQADLRSTDSRNVDSHSVDPRRGTAPDQPPTESDSKD
ncbi:MAG: c-type cytochrome [Pirellulales bacterium]